MFVQIVAGIRSGCLGLEEHKCPPFPANFTQRFDLPVSGLSALPQDGFAFQGDDGLGMPGDDAYRVVIHRALGRQGDVVAPAVDGAGQPLAARQGMAFGF